LPAVVKNAGNFAPNCSVRVIGRKDLKARKHLFFEFFFALPVMLDFAKIFQEVA
jgi:hypothetical protein